MKILLAHNHYQLASGEEVVFLAEKELLEQNGHTVATLETSNEDIVGIKGKLVAAKSAVYSHAARKQMSQELKRFQPDVVHVHNFFPLLSPSIYGVCHDAGIPVVQTLHNYRTACLNAKFFRDEKVCEDCLGKKVAWPGIVHGCYRNSLLESTMVAAMIAVHRQLGTWQKDVDSYITMTAFHKQKMIQAGIPSNKIYVKPHFVRLPSHSSHDNNNLGKYALYVGRLWEEKGIQVLIDAYLRYNLSVPLKIVGEGPLHLKLQQKVSMAGLGQTIEFLGKTSRSEVLTLMRNALVLIVPSIWYETFGLTIIEAFACGLPVLVSRLGGMAELVDDHLNGIHFEPGDPTDLATKIQWAEAHIKEMSDMGKNALDAYQKYYTPEVNYQTLIRLYQDVMKNHLS